ncbi:specifically androgen-regulated gene protein [Pholidichthys leucotaenia]
MPKSNTWPGGPGLETVNGMDSAGSCDSIVSAHSGFSDDSLEHLSAEEKACLMFLEETIESLDTEEDSGLSNDEPDQLPCPGNLATKVADLSDSMSKTKLRGSNRQVSEHVNRNAEAKPKHSYLVPTPLVVANGFASSIKSGTPADRTIHSKPQVTSRSNKPSYKHNEKSAVLPVPSNVKPPPIKPRNFSVRTPEGQLQRGPLSYDALVHLQRSASAKKTPLCPTIDHTIDLDAHHQAPHEGPTFGNLPKSDRSLSDISKTKIGPPVVLPKPKKVPDNISKKIQNQTSTTLESSYSIKHATDPKVVRLEALQKLGLLKGEEPEKSSIAPQHPSKFHSSVDPTPSRLAGGQSSFNSLKSPSFCNPQVPMDPRNKPLQTSASFHHSSKCEHQPASVPHPALSNGLKRVSTERSATLDNRRNGRNCPHPEQITSAKPVKTPTNAPPAPQTSKSVGYTAMVVPAMGADHKEALRKLGLLKD